MMSEGMTGETMSGVFLCPLKPNSKNQSKINKRLRLELLVHQVSEMYKSVLPGGYMPLKMRAKLRYLSNVFLLYKKIF